MIAQIRQVFVPPVFDDPTQNRVASLLIYILSILILLTLVYILTTLILAPQENSVLLFLGGLLVFYGAALAFIRQRRIVFASRAVATVFWIVSVSFGLLGGGINSVSFNSQLVVMLIIALLLGKREVIGFTILSVVADIVLVYLDVRGLIPAPIFVRTAFSIWIIQAGFLVISGTLLYTAVRYFNDLLQRAQRDEQALAQQNQALQDEMIVRNRAEAALRTSEEFARTFQERLKVLHEVSIELTKAASVDELCRKAVELGRTHLGYDRLAIWFFDPRHDAMIGTFGTDVDGKTRDERSYKAKVSSNGTVSRALQERLNCVVLADAPLNEPLFKEVGRRLK